MSTHQQFADELARYALGELAGEERAALERHLEGCAACRRELEALRGDLAVLALSAAGAAPPARARARLMEAVAREPRRAPARRPFWAWVPLATTTLLAVVCVFLWTEDRSLQGQIETVQAELGLARAQRARVQADYRHIKEVLDMFSSPKLVRMTLAPGAVRPQPSGRAIYDPASGHLIFLANNLAPLPPRKMYELWLIPKNGHPPMPAGMFQPDSTGSAMVMLPPLPAWVEAKAFGVTLEPETGSATPTMPLVMAGAGE